MLLDEPASALDPIATAAIEELMHELKSDYTIVIVTHNMQQAARVADLTAFFSLDVTRTASAHGVLVEYDETEKIFTQPADKRTEDYVTGRFGDEMRVASRRSSTSSRRRCRRRASSSCASLRGALNALGQATSSSRTR